MPIREYDFTLILSGVDDITEEVCNALYEAGCDDATPGMREGVVFLDFTREAKSFEEAIASAIRDVERAGVGARVTRVEPDELVTMSDIAARIGRTRENVRQMATGLRGPGGFPAPVAKLTKRSPIWRLMDVLRWLKDRQAAAVDEEELAQAEVIAGANALLEIRRVTVQTPPLRNLSRVLATSEVDASKSSRKSGKRNGPGHK